MAARNYTISGGGLTVANALVTLVGFLPSSTFGVDVRRISIGWSGAATSTQQRVEFYTQVSAYGTAVSATPGKLKLNDPAANLAGVTGALTAGKCGINFSAEGGGAKTIIYEDVFNVLNGYLWVATPDETIIINAGSASAFGVQFPAAPGVGLAGWSVNLTYCEI
jgi:hypothetical protein